MLCIAASFLYAAQSTNNLGIEFREIVKNSLGSQVRSARLFSFQLNSYLKCSNSNPVIGKYAMALIQN